MSNNKYEVQIRLNNQGPTKHLMDYAEVRDVATAFAVADELLKKNNDCYADIVEMETNEIVTVVH